MERQYLIFIVAAAAGFAALLVIGIFFNPLHGAPAKSPTDASVIEATVGKTAYVRYSATVVALVQKLPTINDLKIEAPSELLNTNLGALNGQLRYSGMTISYVEKGEPQQIDEKDFKTIEYRFLPDPGNTTSYTYRNVEFTAQSASAQLIASFVPLSTAKVGQEYPVKIVLEGGPVDMAIAEKTIKVVG